MKIIKKKRLFLIVFFIFIGYQVLKTPKVVFMVVTQKNSSFWTKYCGARVEDKNQLLKNHNKFTKAINYFYFDLLGPHVLEQDLLLNTARLATNELKLGNKLSYLKYLAEIENKIGLVFPGREALSFIRDVEAFDLPICEKYQGANKSMEPD